MNERLSVLIVEDSVSDADLILRQLRKAGYEVSHERVETADQMRTALERQIWDLIITDYSLPQFSAVSAIMVLRDSGMDIPLIVVSGSIGEDKAVALMKSGADDYVAKDKLGRLGMAVKRGFAGAGDRCSRRAAEAALQASEVKYRELVENANSIIIRMDRNGRIVFLNEYAQRLFGYSLEEVLERDVKILVPPVESSGRSLKEMVNRILESPDEFIENVNENILRNGARVWISWRNKAIRDSDGNVIGNLAVGQDITKLKRSEDALRDSEQRFRSLFENSLDGIMVTVTDGKILSANPRMCEILGMNEEEIINAGKDGIFVQDEKLAAGLEEQARTGRFRGELTLRRKDGSPVPVEISTSVFKDIDGITKTGQVVRDITERKQAEQALKQVHNELEKQVEQRTTEIRRQAELLDLAHDAIIVANERGTITFWSSGAEETYGWTREEAVGKEVHSLLRTKFPTSLQEVMSEAERRGYWEGELIHACKEGKHIIVLSRWALRRDSADGSLEIMEVNRDITARKQAEEALRRAAAYNRGLIDASLDPLFAIGPDGKITDTNIVTEMVTGRSREELIGTDFSDYSTDPRKARAGYKLVFKNGFVRDYELEIKHRDGHTTPVFYNAAVYKDESGKVTGIFAAARDISERKRAESALLDKSKALEESNVALKVLIDRYKGDQKEIEAQIASSMRVGIIPYMEKLKQSRLDIGQSALVEIIERNFRDIASPFSKLISSEQFRLTPREIEIASLVREGRTTKEIARILGLGKRTIDSYRDSIRSKLGLANKKVNIRTYLTSMVNT